MSFADRTRLQQIPQQVCCLPSRLHCPWRQVCRVTASQSTSPRHIDEPKRSGPDQRPKATSLLTHSLNAASRSPSQRASGKLKASVQNSGPSWPASRPSSLPVRGSPAGLTRAGSAAQQIRPKLNRSPDGPSSNRAQGTCRSERKTCWSGIPPSVRLVLPSG
jgi:hypothetical protein